MARLHLVPLFALAFPLLAQTEPVRVVHECFEFAMPADWQRAVQGARIDFTAKFGTIRCFVSPFDPQAATGLANVMAANRKTAAANKQKAAMYAEHRQWCQIGQHVRTAEISTWLGKSGLSEARFFAAFVHRDRVVIVQAEPDPRRTKADCDTLGRPEKFIDELLEFLRVGVRDRKAEQLPRGSLQLEQVLLDLPLGLDAAVRRRAEEIEIELTRADVDAAVWVRWRDEPLPEAARKERQKELFDALVRRELPGVEVPKYGSSWPLAMPHLGVTLTGVGASFDHDSNPYGLELVAMPWATGTLVFAARYGLRDIDIMQAFLRRIAVTPAPQTRSGADVMLRGRMLQLPLPKGWLAITREDHDGFVIDAHGPDLRMRWHAEPLRGRAPARFEAVFAATHAARADRERLPAAALGADASCAVRIGDDVGILCRFFDGRTQHAHLAFAVGDNVHRVAFTGTAPLAPVLAALRPRHQPAVAMQGRRARFARLGWQFPDALNLRAYEAKGLFTWVEAELPLTVRIGVGTMVEAATPAAIARGEIDWRAGFNTNLGLEDGTEARWQTIEGEFGGRRVTGRRGTGVTRDGVAVADEFLAVQDGTLLHMFYLAGPEDLVELSRPVAEMIRGGLSIEDSQMLIPTDGDPYTRDPIAVGPLLVALPETFEFTRQAASRVVMRDADGELELTIERPDAKVRSLAAPFLAAATELDAGAAQSLLLQRGKVLWPTLARQVEGRAEITAFRLIDWHGDDDGLWTVRVSAADGEVAVGVLRRVLDGLTIADPK